MPDELRDQSTRQMEADRHVCRPDLKGAKPAHLPIQQPTDFELLINRSTAGNLGIKIPPTLKLRAEFI